MMSKFDMMTRNTTDVPSLGESSTDFQVFLGRGAAHNIIDFTEYKLLRCAVRARDEQQRLTLMSMLDDYVNGHIAVAWRRSNPIFFRITHENS